MKVFEGEGADYKYLCHWRVGRTGSKRGLMIEIAIYNFIARLVNWITRK